MPRHTTPDTSVFSLNITHEAKIRFAAIHNALGFKTKTETFEAILYLRIHARQDDPDVNRSPLG